MNMARFIWEAGKPKMVKKMGWTFAGKVNAKSKEGALRKAAKAVTKINKKNVTQSRLILLKVRKTNK